MQQIVLAVAQESQAASKKAFEEYFVNIFRISGYYADSEAGCQVFRICTVGSTYGFQSFLCPNGTLFNQEVFVCDWWMNVKCQSSQRFVNAQNDLFGNLRLGPQLMKDIKKMLTHPMRNPYDKTAMRSNLIVMQDYRPPTGQLFPNSALIAGPERPPNNIYVPAKQIQQNFQSYTSNDIAFAASTPDTRYIPAGFTNRPLNEDAEVFQRQRQSAQYVQNNNVQTTQHSEIGNLVANGHAPQFTQNRINEQINNTPRPRQNQNFNQANVQYTQSQRTNSLPTQTYTQNIPRGQLNRQRSQFTDLRKPTQINGGKPNEIVSNIKQQYNQERQPYTYRPPNLPFPSEPNSNGNNEVKQNLVSSDVPSTVITKTLTYSKILQDPKPGRPKSRVTVKTWVVKPKSGRLVAAPTSYYYDRPTQPPKERLVIEEKSPYVYNQPTKPPQSERVINENNPKPYVYDRPTTSPRSQRVVEDETKPYTYNRPPPPSLPPPPPQSERIEDDSEPQPYVYNRPTAASKQFTTTRNEPLQTFVPTQPPIKPRVTQAARLNLPPPTLPPTKASRIYLVPTTFKPAARLYLPPDPQVFARQYLPPPAEYQSGQLRAAPTNPSTTLRPSTEIPKNPSFSVIKQSRINASRNNLTFTDILTKEKLDITVNDIVKDTGKILQTASPPQFGQYRNDVKSVDEPVDKYLPSEQDESGEKLTSQNPTAITPSKSSRLISQPAQSLEPPAETPNNNKNSNILSSLPFYKDPSFPNTIERTVSLKITIPERVASYLFKGGNETDFDRLEILNTGSSNYLVLSNHLLNQNFGSSIPTNAALENKNSNTSNSQALVFSFLADSLNAAKEYSNLVKQDALSPTSTPAPQFQNVNNEDFSQITNKISQLTSSHFSANNFNAANIAQTTASTTQLDQGNSNIQANQQSQAQKTGRAQYNTAPTLQAQRQLLSQFQAENNFLNTNLLDPNQNQIYSGQLYQFPVPEVTSHIYNRPQSGNIVQANLEQSTQTPSTPQTTNQNNVAARNNFAKQSSAEVEIVRSQTLPLNPAKLQLEPANELESFYSQESLNSLLNSDNGISAQLQDKIIGTIPHPLEDNKLLTYEKDQSYYLYTKFDRGVQNVPLKAVNKVTNIPNVITFQFVPSVSYQLEDEKDQQKLLNTFNIDEFGAPRSVVRANLAQAPNQQLRTLTSSVDYSVEHPASAKQVTLDPISALYKGPSSYSAPQGSVGSLSRQTLPPLFSSRLEQLNENSEGYPKKTPSRRFVF